MNAADGSPPSAELRDAFGEIDIYLFDQLLRGRLIAAVECSMPAVVADAISPYFLRRGFEVRAVDADAAAIAAVRHLVATLCPDLPRDHICCAPLDALPWADGSIRRGRLQRRPALRSRRGGVCEDAPGNVAGARTARVVLRSSRDQHRDQRHLSSPVGRVRLPDGSDRFVVDERTLMEWTARLGGTLADPLKTTNVQNMRCMTTWVVEKSLLTAGPAA